MQKYAYSIITDSFHSDAIANITKAHRFTSCNLIFQIEFVGGSSAKLINDLFNQRENYFKVFFFSVLFCFFFESISFLLTYKGPYIYDVHMEGWGVLKFVTFLQTLVFKQGSTNCAHVDERARKEVFASTKLRVRKSVKITFVSEANNVWHIKI